MSSIVILYDKMTGIGCDFTGESSVNVIEEVSAERIRKDVEAIVREIPHRAAGSPNGKRMAEYSRAAMSSAGIEDVSIHELKAIVSFPEHAGCRIEAPEPLTFAANTLGHSTQTGPEGISAELLDVSTGALANYSDKDARGKIILTELSYSPARHEKQRIAANMGAVGAIMMNWGHPENTAVPFGSVKPMWGNPTPDTMGTEMAKLPCIAVSRADGLKLREMAARKSVRVWIQTNVQNGWNPVQITVARMAAPPASPEHDDYVLVGGHQDSWPGEAATDNAAGNACMIELARIFGKHRDRLRRGLTFGFWTAHETGTMAGSTWFADHSWDSLRKNCVAYLQIDQPACIGTTEWATSSNPELREFHQRVEKSLLKKSVHWERQAKSGDASFFGIGVPSFQGRGAFTAEELKATAHATLGWWHHSIENRLDKLDWALMQEHIRVYAGYLWELTTAPVLPFRFASVAKQISDRLAELSGAGKSVRLADVENRAARFAETIAVLDSRAGQEAERFAKGGGSEAAAALLNRTMKRLSRMIVPLQSSAIGPYGHDTYGFTPQTTMIPALYDLTRLDKMPDDEQRWMLETKTIRARNRVADTLEDATDLVENAIRQLG
jgi:Peptidase family M28/PA domain